MTAKLRREFRLTDPRGFARLFDAITEFWTKVFHVAYIMDFILSPDKGVVINIINRVINISTFFIYSC